MTGAEDPFVVLAATPRRWAAALHAHSADHGGVVVRATVLTAEDARAEDGDVVVIDDITSFLTPALVADLHRAGRHVLGVFDPDDGQGKGDLVDAGVDALVAADRSPEDLVEAIRALARRGSRPRTAAPAGPLPRADEVTATRGRIIGVTGPRGGVGVTEVAIEVAAAIAVSGRSAVVLDADEVAPALAQRLRLALHPNVLGAVDALRRRADLADGLHPLTSRHDLTALPGMAQPTDWGLVPDPSLRQVIDGLARRRDVVVVDLGSCPARVEGPSGRRLGHALAVAGGCDDLLLVSSPTPVSLARALALRAALPVDAGGAASGPGGVVPGAAAEGGPRLHPVLNRVGGSRYVREQAVAELSAALDGQPVQVLEEDRRVEKAAWQGQRVGRGPFTRGVARLVRANGWCGA